MLPCVRCVDDLETKPDLMQVSIALWLSSLAFHLLSSMINPNVVLGWLNFGIYLAMCEPTSVPLFLVGIMPSSGVAVLLRDQREH